MKDIYDRIDYARIELGLSYAELGELFGITGDAANKGIKRKNLKRSYINTFSDKYGISTTWLEGISSEMKIKKGIDEVSIKKNEVPFENLTVDNKLNKLHTLLIECINKVEENEKIILKIIENDSLEKDLEIEKQTKKLLDEISKNESIEVNLKHRDTKS